MQSAKSLLQTEISNARVNYESSLVSNFALSKDSKIFSYIRSFTTNNGIPPAMSYQSSTITSDVNKANAFDQFFHSVFNSSSTEISLNLLGFFMFHFQ